MKLQGGQQAKHSLRYLGGDGDQTLMFGARTFSEAVDASTDLSQQAFGCHARQDNSRYLKLRMSRGKKYVLRLRLYYADHAGETAVIWW